MKNIQDRGKYIAQQSFNEETLFQLNKNHISVF